MNVSLSRGMALSGCLLLAIFSTRVTFARDVKPDGVDAAQRQASDFLRFKQGDDGRATLESAIVSYRNPDGVNVHLVAALHVGERAYYKGLAKTFDAYDAVLYELIKPKNAGAPVKNAPVSLSMLSMFQRFLKDQLELDFQLDSIDYSAKNFVHADLDAETFLAMQAERGESIFTLLLQSMMSQMKRQAEGGAPAPQISLIDLLAAMSSPDAPRQYKLLLARQFNDLEAQMAGMEGERGSVIIGERNKAAIKVLERSIDEGKREIGIFYGAGHMPGLEAELTKRGFQRTDTEWRVAWDMTKLPEPATRPTTRRATSKPANPEPARDDAIPSTPVR